MAEYHHPEYLISSADLETDLADQTVRVFDATVFLVPAETGYRAESGRAKYADGHVPGSAFMDLIETFADTSTGLGFSRAASLASFGANDPGAGDSSRCRRRTSVCANSGMTAQKKKR